ncbi:MAG: hypothetical protein RIC35_09980 [Marinoscillum sp.]
MKNNLIKTQRNEAQICFQDWCAKVYDENAELINGLATLTGFVILFSAIVKSFKN